MTYALLNTRLITANGLSPGDLNLAIKLLRSLSISPRGCSAVARFMVKSIPLAGTPKYPLSRSIASPSTDKST